MRVIAMRLLLAGILITSTGAAIAADSGKKGGPSDADREFVTKAAADGAAEVELGKMAAKKASSPKVREFAERMVKDHSKAGAELKKLAEASGISASEKPNAEQAQLKAKLEKLSGAEFDRAYMQAMREDHNKAVDLFKKQAQSGGDAGLKKFSESTLPTLEAHKKMAEDAPDSSTSKGK